MTPTTQKVCCGAQTANDADTTQGVAASAVAGEARDPVCRMVVNPATAKHRTEHDGLTYYFCSCRFP
jgi:Cu+-exporting ATPase